MLKRQFCAWMLALALAALPSALVAQTSPGLTKGQVLTAGQWNALFAGKQDTLGYTPMNSAGGVFSGRVVTAAPGASTSGLNLTPGSTPASPSNGDLWVTSAGFYARVNGITIGPIAGGSSDSFAATTPVTVSFPSGVATFACATCGVTGSPLSQFSATTSAQLAGVLSDETGGAGVAVFNINPTLQGATLTGAIAGGGNQINNVVIGASSPLAGGFSTILGTTASAQGLAIGRQGLTNPVLNVDASAATVATGINIRGAAAAGGVYIEALSSGTNENLAINAKGSGIIVFGNASTGLALFNRTVQLGNTGVVAGQLVFNNLTSGSITINPPAGALGSAVWTLQTGTDAFVGRATVDTLTGKTLTASSNVLGGVTMTLGSDATGDIYYRNAGGVLTRLPIGAGGQALTVSGGLPAWAPVAGTGTVTTLTAGTGITFSSGATCTTTCTITNGLSVAASNPLILTGTVLSVTQASKANQQAGSSNAVAVTPLHQQDHDSAAKAWVYFNAAGTIQSSYNVSSVSKGSTGNYAVNFSTAFASTASFGCNVTIAGGSAVSGLVNAYNSASQIQVWSLAPAGTAADPSIGLFVSCFGRQ